MRIGVPKESFPGERRVALIPPSLPLLAKAGFQVTVESGAGQSAGFTDQAYQEKGAQIAATRAEVFSTSDAIVMLRALGANPTEGRADLPLYRPGQVLIAFCDPLSEPMLIKEAADRQVSVFALELVPRTTRAQMMDALSSMATVAGYKAVLLAAAALPKMFPMLTTAAGTTTPAKVLVIGVGVAGLQAIATARRLGGVVSAYDLRPAVKEQVLSLGAKFVELPLAPTDAEGKGGYAKAQDEDFYRRQREVMKSVVGESDVVITTAAVPGKRAPVLVTREMVEGMAPGSVILDLAAERGGNCELTRPDATIVEHGVTIIGPVNLAASVPGHASQLYAKNVSNLLLHLVKEGQLVLDREDEIIRETLVTQGGQLLHTAVKDALPQVPAGAAG